MKVLTAALSSILLITQQCSCAVNPTGCDAVEPVAAKALDLINKGRWDGYLFQLLRVADAHLDKVESTTVYYLVLDVKESDCPVLSRKRWDDCEPDVSHRPSEIVIGQCKVIAITHLAGSEDLRVNDFNCTTSSALANTIDSPVLFDFFEDTELYRKQADKALEKYKRENSDFAPFRVDKVKRAIRAIFGFCRADLFYDVEASDLETPKNMVTNCEVFNLKEHRNFSGVQHHLGRPFHPGEHEHSPAGRPPFKPRGSKDHGHPHESHNFRCPPPPEHKNHSDSPPFQARVPLPFPPPGLRCPHPPFGPKWNHRPPHNSSSDEHHPHGHPKVPKTIIAEDVAHHLGTPKKEVQVKFSLFQKPIFPASHCQTTIIPYNQRFRPSQSQPLNHVLGHSTLNFYISQSFLHIHCQNKI
ncbi:HRG [Cervus elaphus hippelaphus]|uniref:Histidine-rich glycoprotein n=1 Tax=Cervus elaphus hippelaphus TaxID=46360 RepID=A0A212CIM7_CEREH|nr:HRG [Cervus elaphus hippelaphus]